MIGEVWTLIRGLLENNGLVYTSNEMHHGLHQVWKHGNEIGPFCHITDRDAGQSTVLVIAVKKPRIGEM